MRDRAEWRTLLLLGGCYAIWLFAVFAPLDLPALLRIALLVPVLTLHSSLQHECMHGHPFRRQALNDLLAWPPIGILVSYDRFKATHLRHHRNENIADPFDDPESWYLDRDAWRRKSALARQLFLANNTLAGRMVLGPAMGLVGFAAWELRQVRNGDRRVIAHWGAHLAAAVLLLALIGFAGRIGIAGYLAAAYAGMGLLMVRTFLEHRAHERAGARSVIVEDRGLLALLFLNNNFHAVHHACPSLAWYRLPEHFRRNRDRFLAMNGGYRYDSYAKVIRLFAFRRKEPVEWPLDRPPHRP